MHVRSFKFHSSRFISIAMLMTLAGSFIAPSAFAARRILSNDVDRVSMKINNARKLTVSGNLIGVAGDRAAIRVTVTQRSTGAVAEGNLVTTVNGGSQHWEVSAEAQGKQDFEEGPVTVVYFAYATDGGDSPDAHQWLRNIILIKED